MAADLDGSDSYLTLTKAFTALPFTMAIFARPKTISSAYRSFFTTRGSTHVVGLLPGGATSPSYQLAYSWQGTGDESSLASGIVPRIGHWCSYGVSISSTEATVWMGSPTTPLQTAQNVKSHTSRTLSAWKIGVDTLNSSLYNFDGSLAEFACWDIVFSKADMHMLSQFRSPTEVRPENLRLYAPLHPHTNEMIGGGLVTRVNTVVASHPPMLSAARPRVRLPRFGSEVAVSPDLWLPKRRTIHPLEPTPEYLW